MSKGRRGGKSRAARQNAAVSQPTADGAAARATTRVEAAPGRPATNRVPAGKPTAGPARKNTKRTARRQPSTLERFRLPILAGIVVVVIGAVATFSGIGPLQGLVNAGAVNGPVRWASLGTQDAHTLAFVGSTDRLVFGHHGGILQSRDGGRTWQPTGANTDAMAVAAASDGSMILAGHGVLLQSKDDGATFQPMQTDLPALDIHGFARDPNDGNRMWAYIESGGVYESTDGGAHFVQVRPDAVGLLTATSGEGGTRLLAIDRTRTIITSADGGRTWSSLGRPPAPIGSLAASADGRIVLAGTAQGLFRSDDGGATWSKTSFTDEPYSLAMGDDGRTIAVVDENRDFFRSEDGGVTWPGPTTAGG
jgi:photosystem II stability/assembly factor-like uncharacterized protein